MDDVDEGGQVLGSDNSRFVLYTLYARQDMPICLLARTGLDGLMDHWGSDRSFVSFGGTRPLVVRSN